MAKVISQKGESGFNGGCNKRLSGFIRRCVGPKAMEALAYCLLAQRTRYAWPFFIDELHSGVRTLNLDPITGRHLNLNRHLPEFFHRLHHTSAAIKRAPNVSVPKEPT
jgi:hypothetical protein